MSTRATPPVQSGSSFCPRGSLLARTASHQPTRRGLARRYGRTARRDCAPGFAHTCCDGRERLGAAAEPRENAAAPNCGIPPTRSAGHKLEAAREAPRAEPIHCCAPKKRRQTPPRRRPPTHATPARRIAMADFNFFAPRQQKQEPEKKKKKREPLDHSWATRPHGNCCEGDSELCPRWTARIDEGACETWTYPNNYPVRQYQEQIVKQALLKNTLVCLPTGLGKTLIAAVLMYNYHRWFPDGQIIFMAPTKPLVAQQVEACHDVVGLPEEDTAQLDGNVPVERRREFWRKRRVFYCTPQTVANDLAKGVFDASRVVLFVVDEAHRALKKYAYCSVVKHVGFRHAHFRVLALSQPLRVVM